MAARWSRLAVPSSWGPSSVTWYWRGRVPRAPDCHVLAWQANGDNPVSPGAREMAPGHSVVPGMNTSDAAHPSGSPAPATSGSVPAASGSPTPAARGSLAAGSAASGSPAADRYGTLTVAAVPIGRPGDASPLLAQALAEAPLVAAEDTRRLRRLAATLGVEVTGRLHLLLERG